MKQRLHRLFGHIGMNEGTNDVNDPLTSVEIGFAIKVRFFHSKLISR